MSTWDKLDILKKKNLSPVMKILYLSYCMMGGFYWSDIATRKAKYGWWTLTIIGNSSIVVGFVVYIFTTNDPFQDVVFTFAVTISTMYMCIFLPIVAYVCRHDLEEALEKAEDGFGCPDPETRISDPKIEKYDTYRLGILLGVGLVILAQLVYPLMNVVYYLLFCDKTCLHIQLMYETATPFIDHVNSLWVYAIIWVYEMAFFTINYQAGTGLFLIGLLVPFELHNAFVNLITELHHVIDDATSDIQSIQTREEKSIIDSELFDKFRTRLGSIISRYQNVIR